MGTLVFDFGTTALKTVAFDDAFRILDCRSFDFSYSAPVTGRMECDPYLYARAMFETGRAAADAAREKGCPVTRLAVTGQAETLIFQDRAGKALGNAIVWLDDRAKADAERLGRQIPDLFARTGNPGADPVMPLAKLPWVMRELPALDAAYAKALLLHDWAIWLLTGEYAAEYGILSCSGYFDIRKKHYDSGILALAGIDEARLAPPLPPGVRVGGLTKDAAAQLGLTPGLAVSNGTLDQCASAIAAGNVRPGVITETTGTVLAIAASLDRFDPAAITVPVLCHGIADRYLALPYCPTAGILLKWYANAFLEGMDYAEIDRAVEAQTVRNDRLVCLPHFCGEVSPRPDPDAEGAFFGLTLDTTKWDCARAVMESVAFLLRENVEALRDAGCSAETVLALGGGAKSALWRQMKADALGLPVTAPEIPESTALGAALCAALAEGEISGADIPKASGKTAVPGEKRPEMERKYEKYRTLQSVLGNLTQRKDALYGVQR